MVEVVQYAIDGLSLGCLYALFACGLALVFGVAGIANFAYGDFVMIGSYVLVVMVALWWPLVIVIVMLAVALVALLSERIVFRPLREADPTTLLVASFALSSLIESVMIVIAGSRPKGVDFVSSLGKSVSIGAVSVPRLDLVVVAVVVVTLIALTWFLRRTFLGMQLRAASEDFTMARLSGIRANRVIAVAFAVSGAIAGIAAVLVTVRSGSASLDIGLTPVLIAFVAIVVGGMGSLPAAAVGGLLLGAVSVALDAALPIALRPYRDSFLFSLVVLILLVRPQGLLRPRDAHPRI